MVTGQSRWQWRTAVGLVLLAALALLPRLRIVLSTPGVVEADESVFFLMASRIAQLRDAPIFFYGQPYLGSLNEYLAAAFMRLGGFSAASGRAAMTTLLALAEQVTAVFVASDIVAFGALRALRG